MTMLRRRGQWFHPEEYGHKGIAEGVARIVRAGGRVGLGGHGQMQGIGCHWELWNLQSGGLTLMEARRDGLRGQHRVEPRRGVARGNWPT